MLYLKDSYKKELDTKVTESNGKYITLEHTIFYPESGGQASDEGLILKGNEEFKVIKVKKDSGKVVHELDKEGLQAGDSVHCILNWERRYKLMRSHTAAHILSAVFQKEASALVTGNQITPEKIRIDYSLDKLDKEKIKEYIDKANAIIKGNLKVSNSEMKREDIEKRPEMIKLAMGLPPSIKVLRIITIGNIDEQPDAGTHVHNTSEIGSLELISYETRGKENKRIYVRLKENE